MGGIKRHKLIYAEVMIKFALDKLAECDERIAAAYNATNDDPEETGVAMFLTPEFETASSRMEKLKSELEAILDIIEKAEDL